MLFLGWANSRSRLKCSTWWDSFYWLPSRRLKAPNGQMIQPIKPRQCFGEGSKVHGQSTLKNGQNLMKASKACVDQRSRREMPSQNRQYQLADEATHARYHQDSQRVLTQRQMKVLNHDECPKSLMVQQLRDGVSDLLWKSKDRTE